MALTLVPGRIYLPDLDFSDSTTVMTALSIGLTVLALASFAGAFRGNRPALVWIGVLCLFLPIFLYVGRENLVEGRLLDFTSISYLRLFRGLGPSLMAVIFLKALFYR